MSASVDRSSASLEGDYTGWIAGLLVVLGVMAVGAAFWFKYHP